MPKDSHKYRVNQDGQKVFNMMLLAKSMGIDVIWQYIIFKYNQQDIQAATDLAKQNNIKIKFIKSNRWEVNDPLKPDSQYVNNNKKYKTKDYIAPKCHKGTRMGHTCQGYILPCCWMARGDVEQLYPMLCNEQTKLSNVHSVEQIINSEGWKQFNQDLVSNQSKCPSLCWKICRAATAYSSKQLKR